MLSRQLDARKAGVDDRGGDEQENTLEDQAEKVEWKQVEEDDRKGAQHDCHDDRDEERAGAVFAGDEAHRFGNDHADRGGGKEDDDEGENAGNAADQTDQQAGKEGQDPGGEKPQDEVERFSGLEEFLLAADAFLAAVTGGGADGAFGADRFAASITAQRGFHARVVGAIDGSGRNGHRGKPMAGFWFM